MREDASIDELDRQLEEARKERDRRHEAGVWQKDQHKSEWNSAREDLDSKLQSLSTKLSSRAGPQNVLFYMQLMKETYYLLSKDSSTNGISATLPPVSVQHLQASLLQAMHHAFVIFPHQEHILCRHERRLTKYLHKEKARLQEDLAETDNDLVNQVSLVARENHECYDALQQRLEDIQNNIRELEESESQLRIRSLEKQDDETIETAKGDFEEEGSSTSRSESATEEDPWSFNISFGQIQNSWNSFASDHLNIGVLISNDGA